MMGNRAAPRPHRTDTQMSDPQNLDVEFEESSGRHATNLELFLDLVFVFAVTQIAGVLASVSDLAGFGRGLLLAWLVWWLWSQFTWLGTAIDLTDHSLTQFLILAAVPLALLMAVAIPDAYGVTGREFAGAYLAVNLWAIAIQGRGLWSVPSTRRAWLQYAPLAALAPCLLLLGAFFGSRSSSAVSSGSNGRRLAASPPNGWPPSSWSPASAQHWVPISQEPR